jgi:hypothetical protein
MSGLKPRPASDYQGPVLVLQPLRRGIEIGFSGTISEE